MYNYILIHKMIGRNWKISVLGVHCLSNTLLSGPHLVWLQSSHWEHQGGKGRSMASRHGIILALHQARLNISLLCYPGRTDLFLVIPVLKPDAMSRIDSRGLGVQDWNMWGEVIADIAFKGYFTCTAVGHSPPCTVEQEWNKIKYTGKELQRFCMV